MSKVAIISEAQVDELKSKDFNAVKFNPIKDADNNWVISEEEILQSYLEWLKELTIIDYSPKIILCKIKQ